ncbi:Family transcriptional regulator [Candidatus Sulfopaludibacter sp. SbA4]|nr:Family transcriptional regulator [Candidatus Sulfopaludibacter sp. SbA4]
MPVNKSYHHGDLRAALLRASLDLMRQHGLHEFTLREVARRVGVSHAAPFRHFRDKDELLAAIAEEGFIRLTECLSAAVGKDWEPSRRLRNAAVAYVEFARNAPEQFRVMFSVNLEGELHRSVKAAGQQLFATIVNLVTDCVPFSQRVLRGSVDFSTEARIAWAHMHGIASIQDRFGFQSREEIVGFATIAVETLQQGMNPSTVTKP